MLLYVVITTLLAVLTLSHGKTFRSKDVQPKNLVEKQIITTDTYEVFKMSSDRELRANY